MALGGRAAEELIFSERTNGAQNDIEKATQTARQMVTQWGMSEAIGPLCLAEKDDSVFLGREMTRHKSLSEDTARLVDAEVTRIIQEANARAVDILTEKIDVLHAMAAALLERETIDSKEVDLLMAGEPLPPMENGVAVRKPGAAAAAEGKTTTGEDLDEQSDQSAAQSAPAEEGQSAEATRPEDDDTLKDAHEGEEFTLEPGEPEESPEDGTSDKQGKDN
jgi:cell division protease FtsH